MTFTQKISKLILVSILTFYYSAASAGPMTDLAKNHVCLSTVKMLDEFIGDGYGARVVSAVEGKNEQALTFYIEQNFSDGDVQFNVVVNPTPDGYCSFEYTRTWIDDMACMASMSKGALKGLEYVGSVNKNVSYFKSDKGLDYYAHEFTSGKCLIVKKEIGFRQSKQAK